MILRNSLRRAALMWRQARPLHDEQQNATRKELNAYLQIIPPAQTYRIIEGRSKQTQELLAELKGQSSLTKQQELEVEKHLLKYHRFLTIPQIKEACKLAIETENGVMLKLYRRIVSRLERHVEVLQLEDLVDVIYQLAKVNRKQPQLMKAIEDRIVAERLKLHFPTLRKALFTYAHLNVGSASLYGSIAKTIKVGQHELEPLELAQLANLFSRVNENAQGGFGTFRIAEARLAAVLPTLPFDKLVEASHFLLTQDLGSNELQIGLEQFLYKKFPPINQQFSINKLVRLLKSTSGYQFRYDNGCLLQQLEAATMRTLSHMNVEQLEATLWSWGRSSRGSQQLWEKLEFHVTKKVGVLNARGICFGYWSFTKAPHQMDGVLDLLEKTYSKTEINNIHYDLKMLEGMPRRHAVNEELFSSSCRTLIKRIGQLGNQQFMRLLGVMNDSDIDYQHPEAAAIGEALQASQSKILELVPFYRPSQIVDVLFLWTKMNIKSDQFLNRLIGQLSDVNAIPKKAFLKALLSFVMHDQYDKVFEMLRVVYLLREFGAVGYFFPPGEYPLLAYSIFHIVVNGRSQSGQRLYVEEWLTSELIAYLDKLEPGILNNFELKAYKQAKNLIGKWKQQPQQ